MKKRSLTVNEATGLAALPDGRALERTFSQLTRLLGSRDFESTDEANAFLSTLDFETLAAQMPPETPIERAQEIMYDAFDAKGKNRAALARKALDICPDCADAYVLLGNETVKTAEEAADLYEKGVEAGKRSLPPACFEENVGDFWGIVETRPYMRARAGLAQALWAMGRHDVAIGHMQDMLRLNPNDNQGLRFDLVCRYLAKGRNRDAQALMQTYREDDSATMMYARSLHSFRANGPGSKARQALGRAFLANPYVPLMFAAKDPPAQPESFEMGGEAEAVNACYSLAEAWAASPAYLGWMLEEFERLLTREAAAERRRPAGTWAQLESTIRRKGLTGKAV